MPDTPNNAPPPNPNPVPPNPADFYTQFLDQLVMIEEHTKAIPDKIEAQTTAILDVYKNFGKPSREEGTPQGAESGRRSRSSTLDEQNEPLNDQGSRFRQVLDSQTRDQSGPRPRRRAASGYEDPVEAEVNGGPSSSTLGKSWQQRVQLEEGNALMIPRFPGANPTTKDYLDYGSTVAANFAHRRSVATQAKAAKAQQNYLENFVNSNDNKGVEVDGELLFHGLDDQGNLTLGGEAASTSSLPEGVQAQLAAKGNLPPTAATAIGGKISDTLHSAAGGYAQGQYIKGIVSTIFSPMGKLRDVGLQTGAQGGGAGPLGFRGFDTGFTAGLDQATSKIGFSLDNNVSPEQAGTIYKNLYSQGWTQGGQTNDMRTAMAHIMSKNPYIGSMPETTAMLDQATRQGATSLDQFVQIMGKVPQSALAAHTSITQTMADMDQLGQMNKQSGGTYGAGLNNAQAWQGITGLPAGVMGTLMQNPIVQGQTFMGTGLMPFEQGLASPGQHINAIMSSLRLVKGMVASQPGSKTEIGNSGFYDTISGADKQEALIAKTMGIDKATVHTMLTNQRGITAGANLSGEFDSYAAQVNQQVQKGDLHGAWHTMTGAGAGTYSKLRQNMREAVDSQGHKVYEDWDYYNKYKKDVGLSRSEAAALGVPYFKNEQALHARAQETARHNVYAAGNKDIMKYEQGLLMKAGGIDSNTPAAKEVERQIALLNAGEHPTNITGQVASQVARDQKEAMKKYRDLSTQKFGASGSNPSGPRVTIELGPAAKKMFNLNNPQSNQKNQRNAGAVSINDQAWTGASTTPTPNIDTSGGAYQYGSQYDTSSTSG